MRRFMCEADVGDEQKHEDPTVNLLQEMVADLLGKEAALYLPSGTMCNEIGIRVHCRPGEEMLAHRTAHPIHFESGGPAALAGVNVQTLDGPRGQYDAETVETAIRPGAGTCRGAASCGWSRPAISAADPSGRRSGFARSPMSLVAMACARTWTAPA